MKNMDWSKVCVLLGALMGFFMAQECFFLMYKAITLGYTATASWLTGGEAMSQAVILGCISGYLSLCKSDHSEGGITYETAKAASFIKPNDSCGDNSQI